MKGASLVAESTTTLMAIFLVEGQEMGSIHLSIDDNLGTLDRGGLADLDHGLDQLVCLLGLGRGHTMTES